MARPAISFEFPDIPGLADKFRALPASLASAALGTAVKKALQPAQEKLKQITPVGPTGRPSGAATAAALQERQPRRMQPQGWGWGGGPRRRHASPQIMGRRRRRSRRRARGRGRRP